MAQLRVTKQTAAYNDFIDKIISRHLAVESRQSQNKNDVTNIIDKIIERMNGAVIGFSPAPIETLT
jgi:hypothetical protein